MQAESPVANAWSMQCWIFFDQSREITCVHSKLLLSSRSRCSKVMARSGKDWQVKIHLIVVFPQNWQNEPKSDFINKAVA